MKARMCAMLLVVLFLCLAAMPSVAEEGFAFDFPDNIRLAADAEVAVPYLAAGQLIDLHTVTLRDFQVYFDPSLFPEGAVTAYDIDESPEYPGEKSVDIRLSDGSQLYLNFAFSMTWYGENASKYRQLLQYLYDHSIPLEPRQLDFLSPDEAVSLCAGILDKMNLHGLTATAVYGLSSDDLALYTNQMAADYSDMKPDCFSRVTDHDAVYCIEFRSVFDAVPTIRNAPFPSYDGAQCLFLVRDDGPVFIDMNRVIEQPDAVSAQPVAVTLEDALRLFCAGKDVMRSDADDYEITRIAFGYDESADNAPAQAGLQTTYVPCYQIDYLYTLHFGDEAAQIPCEILMSALDGAIIKIRGL